MKRIFRLITIFVIAIFIPVGTPIICAPRNLTAQEDRLKGIIENGHAHAALVHDCIWNAFAQHDFTPKKKNTRSIRDLRRLLRIIMCVHNAKVHAGNFKDSTGLDYSMLNAEQITQAAIGVFDAVKENGKTYFTIAKIREALPAYVGFANILDGVRTERSPGEGAGHNKGELINHPLREVIQDRIVVERAALAAAAAARASVPAAAAARASVQAAAAAQASVQATAPARASVPAAAATQAPVPAAAAARASVPARAQAQAPVPAATQEQINQLTGQIQQTGNTMGFVCSSTQFPGTGLQLTHFAGSPEITELILKAIKDALEHLEQ